MIWKKPISPVLAPRMLTISGQEVIGIHTEGKDDGHQAKP